MKSYILNSKNYENEIEEDIQYLLIEGDIIDNEINIKIPNNIEIIYIENPNLSTYSNLLKCHPNLFNEIHKDFLSQLEIIKIINHMNKLLENLPISTKYIFIENYNLIKDKLKNIKLPFNCKEINDPKFNDIYLNMLEKIIIYYVGKSSFNKDAHQKYQKFNNNKFRNG